MGVGRGVDRAVKNGQTIRPSHAALLLPHRGRQEVVPGGHPQPAATGWAAAPGGRCAVQRRAGCTETGGLYRDGVTATAGSGGSMGVQSGWETRRHAPSCPGCVAPPAGAGVHACPPAPRCAAPGCAHSELGQPGHPHRQGHVVLPADGLQLCVAGGATVAAAQRQRAVASVKRRAQGQVGGRQLPSRPGGARSGSGSSLSPHRPVPPMTARSMSTKSRVPRGRSKPPCTTMVSSSCGPGVVRGAGRLMWWGEVAVGAARQAACGPAAPWRPATAAPTAAGCAAPHNRPLPPNNHPPAGPAPAHSS